MGTGSAKKAAAKKSRSTAEAHRSTSKTLKSEALSPSPSKPSPSLGSKRGTPKKYNFSHRLPTDQQKRGNGRVLGRSLIVWNRPRMAEKLLLHLQYECIRHKVQIPWDAIAHRFHPGSSGGAVVQQLTRLRRELVSEGHMVPPVAHKANSGSVDPEVRGFIRVSEEGPDKETTRPVLFEEDLDDRKFNLPDALHLEDEDSFVSSGSPGQFDSPESPTPAGRMYRSLNDSSGISERTAYPTQGLTYGEVSNDATPGSLASHDDLCDDVSTFTSPQAKKPESDDDGHGFGSLLNPDIFFPPAPHGRHPFAAKHHGSFCDPSELHQGRLPPLTHGEAASFPKTPYEMYAMGYHGYIPWHLGFPMGHPQYNVPRVGAGIDQRLAQEEEALTPVNSSPSSGNPEEKPEAEPTEPVEADPEEFVNSEM